MDYQQFFNSLPWVTKYYLITVFVTTFAITYVKAIPVFYYFYLDYDKILSLEVNIKIKNRSGD
jgi:hypothetical protein